MTKKQDDDRNARRPRNPRGPADAHGDFYFDELMTPQPDATREFFRSRLLKPVKPAKPDTGKR